MSLESLIDTKLNDLSPDRSYHVCEALRETEIDQFTVIYNVLSLTNY